MAVRIWKIVGLAGLAGVAATGAVVARSERKRRAYTPDEVRARLHERAATEVSRLDQRPRAVERSPQLLVLPQRRPYSVPKIATAVVAALIVLGISPWPRRLFLATGGPLE